MSEKKIKPALTFEQQLNLLKNDRKLTINDELRAIEKLKSSNYYRLSAYMKPFMDGEEFRGGTTFDQIIRLYEFDRQLRRLVMFILEPIEIAIKTQVAYLIGTKYNQLAYLDKDTFKNELFHEKFIRKLSHEVTQQAKETVQNPSVLHHIAEYDGALPVWVAVEVMSFGTISMLYKNMYDEDRKAIAGYFGHDERFLSSWLYAFTFVRNIIAHHSRLFNRSIISVPRLSAADRKLGFKEDKLFAVIYTAKKLCKDAQDWDYFLSNLYVEVDQLNDKPERNMIWFPDNWYELLKL